MVRQLAARFSNRNEEVSSITRGLKGLAKELKVPVLVLSQFTGASSELRDALPEVVEQRIEHRGIARREEPPRPAGRVKVALDTNILAYAEGTNGVEMREKALDLVQTLPSGSVVRSRSIRPARA